MPTIKITESVRSARLQRPLSVSATGDTEVAGLGLHVTLRRAFWSLFYQPRGVNPATGKRWGTARHELGDAMLMTVAEARAAALAAKAIVRAGGDPHRDALAARTAAVAERAHTPKTAGDALNAYAEALMNRRQPKVSTRRQSIHYAGKALALMNASSLPLAAIDERAIRLALETMPGSDAERRHVFGGLNRFLAWSRKQGLVAANPCDALDRAERPKPGRAREHVPSLDELKAVWAAVENEPQAVRDLVQFMVLTPLRLNEAAGLTWAEVDLSQARVRIGAERMKNREPHELPLSKAALAILKARQPRTPAKDSLVFPSSAMTAFTGWTKLIARIRKSIGQGEAAKARRFSLHDVRRSFVSILAERGFDVDLLDQCLGHTRRGVMGVYQRASRMAERAHALEAWAGLIGGEEASSNVVSFRTAR
jgi:integrase